MDRGLTERCKAFGVRIVHLYCALPTRNPAQVIGMQAFRSGTSVGAHAREAYRSRSTAEVISKLEVALQELDETGYWLELLIEAKAMKPKRLDALFQEIDELTRILVTAVKTMKRRKP